VGLGLFDEATAMEKFQKWFSEHEAQIKKRQEEAMRNRRGGRRPHQGGRRPEGRPERRAESSSGES
jgi:small subunit ribosomal protein S16